MNLYRTFLIICSSLSLTGNAFASSNHCGDQGVWIESLGAGSGELNDGQASPSYLIWHDDVARVLVDMGAGSQIGFEKSGASFDTIEAIAFTQLRPDHSADLPAYIGAAQSDTREQRLTIMGPTGDGGINPATRELIERLFGPEGAYPHLADALKSPVRALS